MSKDEGTQERPGQRPIWFDILLLLDAFALGGLVALRLGVQPLESTMGQLTSVAAQSERLNVLDKLVPYWVSYAAVSLILGWITIGAFVWLRTKSRIVMAATVIVPLIVVVSFFASRGLGG